MISKILLHLSKKASRKNLEVFINESFKNELNKKNHKILNIGSGGEIEKLIKKNFSDVYSIDIDKNREPDLLLDVCDENFIKKIDYRPSIICCFEVLEHTKNPSKAIENIFELLHKGNKALISVPFNFHIHDEPNDYYRFTYYGLKLLFNKFSKVEIKKEMGG